MSSNLKLNKLNSVLLHLLIIQTSNCFESSKSAHNHEEKVKNLVQNKTEDDKNCNIKNELKHGALNFSYQSAWSNFSAKKYGNSHDFGNFVECQNISTHEIPAKYCIIQYFHDFTKPISVPPSRSIILKDFDKTDISFFGSVCIPTNFDDDDVQDILESDFRSKNLSFGQILCKRIEKSRHIFGKYNHWLIDWWNFERILIFSSIILLSLFLLILNLQNYNPINIFKDLFAYNIKSSSTAYLNGFKAISTIIVILFHCWLARVLFPFKNGKNLDEFANGIFYRPIWVGNAVMENFFVIGGILATKALSRGFDESNKLKWILKYYIKRIMRLLPVTALILGLVITSDAELFAPFNFGSEKENCKRFWWMTLTYNFLDSKYYFARFIWFISVYMQLTFAAPFVFWLTKVKNFEIISSVLIVASSAVLRCLHTSNGFYDKAIRIMGINVSADDEIFSKLIATQYRLLPFFGGLILGKYIDQEIPKFKLRSIYVIYAFGAILCMTFITLLYIPELLSILDVFLVLNLILFFYALHHDSGTIKNFLSHRFWVPLSKAGLSAYLVVSYYQFGIQERQLEPLEIQNEFQFMFEFLKDILQSIVPVLFVYVLVEEPFSRLGEYLASKI